MSGRPRILVIDNYDSFVYNVVQYLGELGADVVVRRNDECDAAAALAMAPDGVVISPGPGHPRQAGASLDIIRACADAGVPVLGICLGHQAIGEIYGLPVGPAPELRHGRASQIIHGGTGLFRGVPSPLTVGRYHSLIIEGESEDLEVTARCGDLVMAVRHRRLPVVGVQFHPESVLTDGGYLLLANWLESCGDFSVRDVAERAQRTADAVRERLPKVSVS